MRPNGTELDRKLAEAVSQYRDRNPRSRRQHERARRHLHEDDAHCALINEPFPITLVGGRGAHVFSIDEADYLDYLGNHTASLYGHSNALIAEAIEQAIRKGLAVAGHTEAETELAALLCERFKSLDLVRFTCSGTEANLMAITAALEYTGRRRIVVFEGAYHGSVLNFSSSGTYNVPHDFVVLDYNNVSALEQFFLEQGDRIAAVLVEPMLCAGGCIPATSEFLRCLRELTEQHGSLLIFDEVTTSRLSPGGLQERLAYTPDFTTLGKYLGGGLNLGAFGGRWDILRVFDPLLATSLEHARTFNNQGWSIHAGLVGLRDALTPPVNRALNLQGDQLRQQLASLVHKSGLPMTVTGIGAIIQLHMCEGPVNSFTDTKRTNRALRDLFYYDLIAGGIWCERSATFNLSLPMRDPDRRRLVKALDNFIAERCELF